VSDKIYPEERVELRGDTVRLLSMHTSGSLHLGLHLMCFCVIGSSQKRHSVWRHLPGALVVCVCACVCVVDDVCEREMRQAMKWVVVEVGIQPYRRTHEL